jgi:hypothetical protein
MMDSRRKGSVSADGWAAETNPKIRRVETVARFGCAELRAIKTGLGRCHHDRPRDGGCGSYFLGIVTASL